MLSTRKTALGTLVYKAIYAIDNCFDDDPKQFAALASQCPHTVHDVRKLENSPCGFLIELAKQSPTMDKLLHEHPEFISAMNSITYLTYRSFEAQQECDLRDVRNTREHFMELGRRNFHMSLFARIVEQISRRKDTKIELDRINRNIDLLLAENFVSIDEFSLIPNALLSDMPASDMPGAAHTQHTITLSRGENQGRQLVCDVSNQKFNFDQISSYEALGAHHHGILVIEASKFPVDEFRDFLSDLDEEKETGAPTPNLLVNYVRFKHPEINLLQCRDSIITALADRRMTRKTCYLSLAELEPIVPDLYAILAPIGRTELGSEPAEVGILRSLMAKKVVRGEAKILPQRKI